MITSHPFVPICCFLIHDTSHPLVLCTCSIFSHLQQDSEVGGRLIMVPSVGSVLLVKVVEERDPAAYIVCVQV